MALPHDTSAARQARLEKMLEDLRAAEQRRLVKQGIALWNQTEAADLAARTQAAPPLPRPN
jgi:hypothetical protein